MMEIFQIFVLMEKGKYRCLVVHGPDYIILQK